MTDLCTDAEGAQIVFATSSDDRYPADNILKANSDVWITTGMYPQEVIISLGAPATLQRIKIAALNVQKIRVERTDNAQPVGFEKIVETEYAERGGRLQTETHTVSSSAPTRFLRITVLSGWDDFCALQKVEAIGTRA